MNKLIEIICDSNSVRVDSYLSKKLDSISRTYIKQLISEGNILVNDKLVKPNHSLKTDDKITVVLPEAKDIDIKAQDLPIDIIFEDSDILIVNKKKGMVVHPAPGNPDGTLVNALLYYYKDGLSIINGENRPGIVHRIDKDTSGVLVVAKSDSALRGLSDLFKEHDIKREYIALVYGVIAENAGSINAPIGRDPKYRKKMAVNTRNGKRAFTKFEVLKRYNGYTLIKATLETGRTHQIRVHMKYIGHTLVGDELYQNRKDRNNIKGQMLHAEYLGFVHPITKEFVEFRTELPEYFKSFLEGLK